MTRLERIEHKLVAGITPTEHELDLCWLIGQVRIARADADNLARLCTSPRAHDAHDIAVSIRDTL